MNGRYVLTLGELHLIQAIIRRSPVIGGLEEFALRRETRPEARDREGLMEKGILIKTENGRLALEKTAGYAFSTLIGSPACLRGQLLWPTGEAARFNLYLHDTAFMTAFMGDLNRIEFLWVPAIQPLIGSMLALMHRHGEYRAKSVLGAEDFSEEAMRCPLGMLRDAQALGVEPAFAAAFESRGTMFGWAGKKYLYLLDQEGGVYCAEPKGENGEKPVYQELTAAKALASLNSSLLTVHMAAIQMAGRTDGDGRA